MNTDPLDTTQYEVPFQPLDVVAALREMADGDSDYLGRLLLVAAFYVEEFARTGEASDPTRLERAIEITRPVT